MRSRPSFCHTSLTRGPCCGLERASLVFSGACSVPDGAGSFLPRFSSHAREEGALLTGCSQPRGLVLAVGKEMIWCGGSSHRAPTSISGHVKPLYFSSITENKPLAPINPSKRCCAHWCCSSSLKESTTMQETSVTTPLAVMFLSKGYSPHSSEPSPSVECNL